MVSTTVSRLASCGVSRFLCWGGRCDPWGVVVPFMAIRGTILGFTSRG
jgi:hypothetical protein